jgi:hypothetical protein
VTTLAAGKLFMLETDEHVIVDSGGEKCISAGNIWRVNRLDRGHDPVMVPADSIRQSSATSGPSIRPRKLSTILVRRILTNQLFENPKPMTDITIRCKQSSGLPDRSATFLGQKICIAQPSIW